MLQNTSTDTPKPGKSGFQEIRMIEWGKNDNPKNSLELPTNPKPLDQKLNRQKISKPWKFTERSKWCYTKNLIVFYLQNYAVGRWISDCFEYPKKSLLESSHPKKILAKCSYPKKSRNKKLQTQKILRPSLSLEIQRTLPGQLHQTAHSLPPFEICYMKQNLCWPSVRADNDLNGGNWQ